MPHAALRPCAFPSCPTLVTRGSCPQHSKPDNGRTRPEGSQKFYSSRTWKRLRARILWRDKICQECKRNKQITPATTVDHIDGNWQNNADSNLEGLCIPCHSHKSGVQHNQKKVRTL